MAVPAYLRQDNKAEFVTVAVRLASWTLKWCKDERLFTRRERWIITGDIWTEAKRVLLCVKMANRRSVILPDDYEARTAYLKQALDALTSLKMLLTIKYEMMLQGFNAAKAATPKETAQPSEQTSEQPETQKKKRGGRKRLTQDDIDRIFEIFFQMAIHEQELIKGLLESDATRHAHAKPPV